MLCKQIVSGLSLVATSLLCSQVAYADSDFSTIKDEYFANLTLSSETCHTRAGKIRSRKILRYQNLIGKDGRVLLGTVCVGYDNSIQLSIFLDHETELVMIDYENDTRVDELWIIFKGDTAKDFNFSRSRLGQQDIIDESKAQDYWNRSTHMFNTAQEIFSY